MKKPAINATVPLIFSHTFSENGAPLPYRLKGEEDTWLIFFSPRHKDALMTDAEAYFQQLLDRLVSPTRHLILSAPAPAPAVEMPWGLERLLAAEGLLQSFLRAVLCRSATCRLSLLLPQAGTPAALAAAHGKIEEVMRQLYAQGIPFDDMIPIGVTLGTPASLLSAAAFGEAADFAVIDTDSLLTLSLAAAPETAFFEESLAANLGGILRLSAGAVSTLHAAGRYVAIMGRLAADAAGKRQATHLGADALILPFPSLHTPSTPIRAGSK